MLKCISAPEAADPTNAWRLFLPVFRKAYYMNATVYIGEILDCEIEPENDHDKYAVAVKNNICSGRACWSRTNRTFQDFSQVSVTIWAN